MTWQADSSRFCLVSFISGTARDQSYQGDLGHIGGVTLALAQLRDARIATGAASIARGQLVKDFLDNQLVWNRLQDAAARMQFDSHRFICSLQSPVGLIFIRDDAK